MTPTLTISVLAETFGLRVSAFKVTPKGELHDRQFGLRAAFPHLLGIALGLAALVSAWVTFDGPSQGLLLGVSVFWVIYNLLGSLAAVFLCIERPRSRGAERTRVDLPAEVVVGEEVVPAAVLDLSVTGARVVVPWSPDVDPSLFSVRGARISALVLPEVGRIAGEGTWVSSDDSGATFGFAFAPLAPDAMVGIVGLITASPFWVRGDREERAHLAGALGRTVVANARRSTIAARAEVRHFTRARAELVPIAAGATDAVGTETGPSEVISGSEVVGAPEVTAQPIAVRVEDLSFAGCRVRSSVRFEVGQKVTVSIPDVLGEPVPAEVRWVSGRSAPFRMGLRLTRS